MAALLEERGIKRYLPLIPQVRHLIRCVKVAGSEPEIEDMVEGRRVRIMQGAFRGVEGARVQQRGKSRVLVGLSAIGQAVGVEVEDRHLELCGRPPAGAPKR